MRGKLKILYALWKYRKKYPQMFSHMLESTLPSICKGLDFSRTFTDSLPEIAGPKAFWSNPLWEYFQRHKEGPGIWKWEHYFDIYHRHFSKFIGLKVDVLEIGIYSGGSLEMWRSYFGKNCHIYGVDIQKVCESYANDHVSVYIGDQADRIFWSNFKNNVDGIDILIDDGGHTPEQQQITLEEMLPQIRPGGIYLCEDVHGTLNEFAAFATGLVNDLNSWNRLPGNLLSCSSTQFQSIIHSIHFYPFIVVIEKRLELLPKLSASRRGTEWQPPRFWERGS